MSDKLIMGAIVDQHEMYSGVSPDDVARLHGSTKNGKKKPLGSNR